MKPTAILVNTARGGVVKQAELAAALRAGTIASAAIDVFEVEPVAHDDALVACKNAVFAPHLGSATFATRARMSRVACENIVAVLEGRRPPFLVNPAVWQE
jgi:phosphoglycerate dehydrogenase-like enzyme